MNPKVGDKVHYVSGHGEIENGIVKEIPTHTSEEVRVVYHWDDDWKNYADYTSALTKISDLKEGWISKSVKSFVFYAQHHEVKIEYLNQLVAGTEQYSFCPPFENGCNDCALFEKCEVSHNFMCELSNDDDIEYIKEYYPEQFV